MPLTGTELRRAAGAQARRLNSGSVCAGVRARGLGEVSRLRLGRTGRRPRTRAEGGSAGSRSKHWVSGLRLRGWGRRAVGRRARS